MNGEQYELPEGWGWKALPEVAEIIMGQSPPGSTYNANGNGLPFYQGKTDFGELHPTLRVWCTQPTKIARPNDILMSVRAPVGPTNIADSECAIGRGLCVIRPHNGMPSRYLREYFRLIEDQIADMGKGSTFTSISRADLVTIEVPVAPLPEQHIIVEKIERLFAESRTAREALDKVPALLKRFRQSVLAKAFQGALTPRPPLPTIFVGRGGAEGGGEGVGDEPASVLLERIREERRRKWEEGKGARGKKFVEPEPPDTSDLPELPGGWEWTTVGEVIDVLQYGTSVKADADVKTGIPVLRMGNIQDGRIDFSGLKFIDPAKDDIPRYVLGEGDILINRTNSPELVGKAALFEGQGKYVFASYLIRLQTNPNLMLPRYLAFVINSEIGRRHVAQVKHQVAGQANINSQNIREMPLPLAPLAEQRRIVAKIESLFAQAEAIERAVEVARRRAEKVDQAILARAFRGEL